MFSPWERGHPAREKPPAPPRPVDFRRPLRKHRRTMNLPRLIAAATIVFVSQFAFQLSLPAADRAAGWKAVAEAQKLAQPKTASAALDKIITDALADGEQAEALKAILQKTQIDASVEERSEQPAFVIRALNAWVAGTPPADAAGNARLPLPLHMRPLLEAALAKTWWTYYMANRWQLLQRTQTAESPSDDFLTWDARRVLTETGRHFEAALAGPATLQHTPISALAPLLIPGDVPDAYRPTLYDFLVNEAIGFYSAGEQGVPKSSDAFEPDADSPILGTLEEYLAWNPADSGSAGVSPALRAIQLYQQLLRFHLNDPAPQFALADTDLARISWAASLLGESARERHPDALRTFIKRWEKDAAPIAVNACARLAGQLQQTDPAAAHAAATEGLRIAALTAFITTRPANTCRNIIAQLEAPSLAAVVTEHTWTDPWPGISVKYRNQKQIHFRAVPWEWKDFLDRKHNRPENLSHDEFAAVLARTPGKTWSAPLASTPDYAYRTEKLPAPRDLNPGFYFIVASLDEKFSNDQNIIGCAPVWVSNLAIVRDDTQDGRVTGYVVNATTGEPVANATVAAWRSTNTGVRGFVDPVRTNSEGAFRLNNPEPAAHEYPDYILLATAPGGQAIATSDPFYIEPNPEPARATDQIHFFTDRSLYRPGQSIQFKAVLLRANPEQDGKNKLLSNRRVTVVLDDSNGKEAARGEFRTNDFGSLSGSFTVPPGRLTGVYRLHTTNGEQGSAIIRIEEYKRPKFEVTLDAPETAPKLDDTVTLTGAATAYTGAAIDGAKVTWRVRRLVRWPRWCWWFIPTITNREIAHGTATTAGDGKFTITFDSIPDKTADPKNEPIFDYAIAAEVTDTTGETRTATRTISVGYTALAADISADEWQTTQNPVRLTLSTTTLDGVAQTAKGIVAIHPLEQPATVPQTALPRHQIHYQFHTGNDNDFTNDPADIRNWPEAGAVATLDFNTAANTGKTELAAKLRPGIYRALVKTHDRFGKTVTARTEFRVLEPDSKRYGIKESFSLAAPEWTAHPGETFTALWSSGHDKARALVSIEQNGKILRRYWTSPGVTQQKIPLTIAESMRGGVTLRIFQVRDNRLVSESRQIEIPWDNKRLEITWERFNSKLTPGGRETWTAKITGPNATQAAAEMTAALYDASLDQFYRHSWSDLMGIHRQNNSYRPWYRSWHATNESRPFALTTTNHPDMHQPAGTQQTYRRWDAIFNYWETRHLIIYSDGDIIVMDRFNVTSGITGKRMRGMSRAIAAPGAAPSIAGKLGEGELAKPNRPTPDQTTLGASEPPPAPDLSAVTARKNLSETAFFFPQLRTDPDGSVRMEFTVPEALTRWKFLGFAHDKQLRSAVLTDTAVTAKDLMVQPNPPRFLREGDTIEFTVKITNMTGHPQTGAAQLTFADASSLEPVDLLTKSKIENPKSKIPFSLAPNSSQTLSWRITIPDGQGFLTYKAVASTGAISDGEEGFLPVLSRRQLVTESITLPIRDAGTRTFRFDKLADSALQPFSLSALSSPALSSSAFSHESLTVQMTSNPAWYAVLALPNLMEFPHECSEQLFNRHYANALAAHIASSDPKIARVFEQWRNTPALDSPLLKNDDLKSVLIEETPWLRDATRESEQRRAIGQLFDINRTAAQTDSILNTLEKRQGADGLWSWFPGGKGSTYITRYLVAGFARLRHFGITSDKRADAMLKRAVPALDAAFAKHHAHLIKENLLYRHTITSADAYQLYVRSFFLKEIPISENARAAYDFFAGQARKHWPDLPCQSQGHAALALARMGDAATPAAIVTSLKQRAKNSDELGMYWADADRGWFWWQAPIETQALMIEVFDEVARDVQAVVDLQLWLLKQKQTQAWPSTKATADAVYALLLRGANKLASDALVTVTLGDGSTSGTASQPMSSSRGQATQSAPAIQPEAGTGFYSYRIPGVSVTPTMGEKITVTKTDAGPVWGSITWQYFQSIDKITPHEGTPLTLRKTLWKQINTASGPTLVSLDSAKLEPGDTLVARIELRTDRDMEFVHMKDQRGSGTEPVNVLSGYRWKNGLGYYESTRDTATHFFMDWLPAGTHVFEYPLRVQLRGEYESGIAEIQSMYAPEYNSHSASTTLVVE
jgi:hypothetical protein